MKKLLLFNLFLALALSAIGQISNIGATKNGRDSDIMQARQIVYPDTFRNTQRALALSKLPDTLINIIPLTLWFYDEYTDGNDLINIPVSFFQPLEDVSAKIPDWCWGSAKPLWMTFRLENHSVDTMDLLLYSSGGLYTRLFDTEDGKLRELSKGGWLTSGFQATYPKHRANLPFHIAPNTEKTMYVKFSIGLQFKPYTIGVMSVETEQQIRDSVTFRNIGFYMYYTLVCGLLFFLALTGIFRYLMFKDKSYLYYGLSVGLNSLYFFQNLAWFQGMQGLVGSYTVWLLNFQLYILILSYAAYYRFIIHFLDLQHLRPTYFIFFKRASLFFFCIAPILPFCYSFINNSSFNWYLSKALLVLIMAFSVYGLIAVWRTKTVLSRIVFCGIILFIIGSVFGFLSTTNYYYYHIWGSTWENALIPTSLGTLAETIIFFGALGYREKILKRTKKEAEDKLLSQVLETIRIEQQAYLEKEVIARDLHDEVGSTLSAISILSASAQRGVQKELDKVRLSNIGDKARAALESMSDIVWSVNPENDPMEKVLTRMSAYASEMLEDAGTELKFVVGSGVASLTLPMEKRKDFYLIFKESIHNCAKYARAKQVIITLEKENNLLIMSIKDDGIGFDLQSSASGSRNLGGNGLRNMRNRAVALGGNLEITTTPGNGTTIRLSTPVI